MKMYHEEAEAKGVKLDKKPSQSFAISKCDMEVQPSPPVPQTSSAFVGWRSSHQKYSLEIVGPLYVSPLHTIDPPGRRPRKQLHICIC
ncbi:hypothetical protein C0J52_17721 [Blattella germanica]|nr:hypothetical protein C0J52_17721 [Blattella germanica]